MKILITEALNQKTQFAEFTPDIFKIYFRVGLKG